MKKEELIQLADKILKKEATTEEISRYNDWFNSFKDTEDFVLLNAEEKRIAMLNRIHEKINGKKNSTSRLWPRVAAVAAVFIVVSAGIYFNKDILSGSLKMDRQDQKVYDIDPGSNKAILTLSNGKRVDLKNIVNGEVAEQSGVQITKSKDGQLIYTMKGMQGVRAAAEPEINTIETPKGGQYQIMLPDGTEVWLNAASSLKFPANFEDLTQRSVQLKGEAYFHVAKDKSKPFLVKTEGQEVKVLGTRFNINAYAEETDVKTTLIEGAVHVTGNPDGNEKTGFRLKPGEQSLLRAGHIKVKEVDPDEAIAWKNGDFMFNNEELESIMNQIARWYDVEVIYQNDEIRKKRFNGAITKFNKVSKVLKMLELTGHVRFNIGQKSISVMN